MKLRREKRKGGGLEVPIVRWNGGAAEAGTDTGAVAEVVTGKTEEIGIGSERKKTKGAGEKREIMIRKEVARERKIGLEKDPKKGKVRVI